MLKEQILQFRGMRSNFRHFFKKMVLGTVNLCSGYMDFIPLHRLRQLLLQLAGVRTGANIRIGDSMYLLDGRNLEFGKECIIGHFLKVFDWHEIKIGDKLFASNCLTMVSATHDPITYESLPGPITIGDNVWIGINVTIVGPVTIGQNAVIGAGALVIRDIPDNAIVAGIPAKIIRYKNC